MITDDKIKDVLLSSKSAGTIKVGFLLVPNFSMIAFSAAIEPLRVANRVAGETIFEWVIASSGDEVVTASNGVSVNIANPTEDLTQCRLVFICSGIDVQSNIAPALLNITRRLDRQGGHCRRYLHWHLYSRCCGIALKYALHHSLGKY